VTTQERAENVEYTKWPGWEKQCQLRSNYINKFDFEFKMKFGKVACLAVDRKVSPTIPLRH